MLKDVEFKARPIKGRGTASVVTQVKGNVTEIWVGQTPKEGGPFRHTPHKATASTERKKILS